MEDHNKLIESLGIRYIESGNIKITKPVKVENFYEIENTIMLVNKGNIYFGPEQEKVLEGDMLFIPGGKALSISFGSTDARTLSNEEFTVDSEKYLQNAMDAEESDLYTDGFSRVMFEAKVFDAVNFFSSLNIPPFVIRNSDVLAGLIGLIVEESSSEKPGKNRVIKVNTEYLVIEVLRYITDNRLFVEEFVTNSIFFKDPRLVDLFTYIKKNLSGDLSNKVLARVAGISDDYAGQYFKMLTGMNPQDYIEYQRMQAAVDVLMTTKKSIRDVGKAVGYNDTAYFCRRFKMMFGIPAGKMRKRESLENVRRV